MKVLDLERLHTADLCIGDISVIYQTPSWSTLGAISGKGRILNGFLLIDSGECTYEWEGGSADLSKGGLIYLPSGAKRAVTVTSRPFSFYRICFTLTDISDGETVIFSETPMTVTENASARLFELAGELLQSTVSRAGVFKSISRLAEFFHIITKQLNKTAESRISPAIAHLDRHYSENTDAGDLAAMCYISKPHLFRLFQKELGMSPIEYRNRLRIERAKLLLADGECSVGEIAAMLGFEESYYFSRMFKKYTGVSPSRYAAPPQ